MATVHKRISFIKEYSSCGKKAQLELLNKDGLIDTLWFVERVGNTGYICKTEFLDDGRIIMGDDDGHSMFDHDDLDTLLERAANAYCYGQTRASYEGSRHHHGGRHYRYEPCYIKIARNY